MEKATIEIYYTEGNFSAYIPDLPGCISVGDTPEEIKKNILEAAYLHISGSIEDNDPIDEKFKKEFEFVFHFNAESLLKYYEGIFSKAALERLTGINQKQLSHYANGIKKPRATQRKKIETALHNLGKELLLVEL